MLQVARLAPKLLGEAASSSPPSCASNSTPTAAFRIAPAPATSTTPSSRLEALIALQQDLPVGRDRRYLETFGDGAGLDFVHLACLARCWAALGKGRARVDGLLRHRSCRARRRILHRAATAAVVPPVPGDRRHRGSRTRRPTIRDGVASLDPASCSRRDGARLPGHVARPPRGAVAAAASLRRRRAADRAVDVAARSLPARGRLLPRARLARFPICSRPRRRCTP